MGKDGFELSIKEADLKDGQMRAVRLKGKPILLVRQSGEVYALSNYCPHMGCTLEGGILKDYVVMCPCHGWKFDIRNGQYTENSKIALQTYRCRIEEGKISVEVEKQK